MNLAHLHCFYSCCWQDVLRGRSELQPAAVWRMRYEGGLQRSHAALYQHVQQQHQHSHTAGV